MNEICELLQALDLNRGEEDCRAGRPPARNDRSTDRLPKKNETMNEICELLQALDLNRGEEDCRAGRPPARNDRSTDRLPKKERNHE